MYYYNIFFIYSVLGFLFENLVNVITRSNFNSGVLYGPWTFIYGFAIFAILVINKFLRQYKLKKWIEVLIFYVCATVVMTLIEFTGGMLIEKIFDKVYWDYTHMTFNYGHYICLEVSLLWGLFATVINYLVTPHLLRLAKKIPWYFTVVAIIIFVVDVIVTFLK